MIIYGVKPVEIGTEKITNKCPNCGLSDSVKMVIIQKYFHIFWIPFFPCGKVSYSECSECKQVLYPAEFNRAFNEHFVYLKSRSKTPLWTFAIFIGFGLAMILGYFGNIVKDKNNAVKILNPEKGDVYELKVTGSYTLARIDSVFGDSVILQQGLYETEYSHELKSMRQKGDESYGDIYYTVSKGHLKMLLETEIIDDIIRDRWYN